MAECKYYYVNLARSDDVTAEETKTLLAVKLPIEYVTEF